MVGSRVSVQPGKEGDPCDGRESLAKGWCLLEKLHVPQHDLDCCPAPPQSTLPYAQLLTPAVSSKRAPHLVPTSGPLHSSSLLSALVQLLPLGS